MAAVMAYRSINSLSHPTYTVSLFTGLDVLVFARPRQDLFQMAIARFRSQALMSGVSYHLTSFQQHPYQHSDLGLKLAWLLFSFPDLVI
jgi:hypothetical protein